MNNFAKPHRIFWLLPSFAVVMLVAGCLPKPGLIGRIWQGQRTAERLSISGDGRYDFVATYDQREWNEHGRCVVEGEYLVTTPQNDDKCPDGTPQRLHFTVLETPAGPVLEINFYQRGEVFLLMESDHYQSVF